MQRQFPNSQLEHMVAKFLFGFMPVVHHDNSIQIRRASFLSVILPVTLVALLFIILSQAVDGRTPVLVVAINTFAGITCLVLGYWIHRGNIAWGSFVFLALVFIYITLAVGNFGTVRTPMIAGYLFLIIGSGIVFGSKGIGVAFVFSVLALLGLIVVEENGPLRSAKEVSLITQWPIYVAFLIIAGGIVFWIFQVMWQALARVDRQMAELQSSPVAIMITDDAGNIEYVNPKYTQMMGYTLDEVRVTKPPFFQLELMPPTTYAQLWATLLAGQVWHSEFQSQTKNGELFLASYSITPITQVTGQIMHFVIVIKDVSERKRVEAERMALSRTREFATLYEITHDLGTFSDIPTLFDTILTRIVSLLNVYAGAIYLLDTDRHEFDLVSEIGISLRGLPVPHDEWLSDYSPRIYTEFPPTVRVPIRYGDECLGMLVLTIVGSGNSRSDKPNLNLLALLATQVASVIHNLHMFEQVRISRVRAQVLAKEVLSAQESERRLISRELHDEFGQELTSVQLGLQHIARLVNQSNVQMKLNNIMASVEHVLEQMRNLSRGLRPSALDDFGLVPALEWLIEQQFNCEGLNVEIIANEFDVRLLEEVETVCFRVAQEALTNVVRHGRATRVVIELRLCSERLELKICDNGIGFDLVTTMKNAIHGKSLGLLNMHERVELVGGQMRIITAPGQGTQIHAEIPLKPQSRHIERRITQRSSS